jgi:hypothetical protein
MLHEQRGVFNSYQCLVFPSLTNNLATQLTALEVVRPLVSRSMSLLCSMCSLVTPPQVA